jgi:hypothetical protein
MGEVVDENDLPQALAALDKLASNLKIDVSAIARYLSFHAEENLLSAFMRIF